MPSENRHVEVDQQANLLARKTQIRQQLRLVDGYQLLNGLYLNDDGFLDDQISTKAAVEPNVFVHNWNIHLTSEGQPTERQLMTQTFLIY
jgi:hypothetical protein